MRLPDTIVVDTPNGWMVARLFGETDWDGSAPTYVLVEGVYRKFEDAEADANEIAEEREDEDAEELERLDREDEAERAQWSEPVVGQGG